MSVSCLIRRFIIQVSSGFPGTLTWYVRRLQPMTQMNKYTLSVGLFPNRSSCLLWDLFGCVSPRVSGGVALLGSGAVPHVAVLCIPLTSGEDQFLTPASPSVLHRFGGWGNRRALKRGQPSVLATVASLNTSVGH